MRGMKIRASLAFLAVSLSLAAAACGPSIDAAAKADIDKRVAALGAPRQSYPAPTGFQPMPFAAGQWLRIKLVDDKGTPSFITQKVLAQEGDAFWIESVNETYTGRTITKLLLAIPNRMDPNSVDIRAASIKDHKGHVTDFTGPLLSLMKSSYQNVVSTLTVSWQGLPQEDVSVPAGSFAGSYKARTDATWGPWHMATTSWGHSSVPISGMVKSVGIDKPTTMELVDFGLTGAVSEF
jgi:hypothetical protein